MYNNKQILDYIKTTKELSDLYNDRQNILKLYREQNPTELQQYITKVEQEHPLEMAVYNSFNTRIPMNIEQNVIKYIDFIDGIIIEKVIETLLKR